MSTRGEPTNQPANHSDQDTHMNVPVHNGSNINQRLFISSTEGRQWQSEGNDSEDTHDKLHGKGECSAMSAATQHQIIQAIYIVSFTVCPWLARFSRRLFRSIKWTWKGIPTHDGWSECEGDKVLSCFCSSCLSFQISPGRQINSDN